VIRLILSVERTGWQVVNTDARADVGRHCRIIEVDGKPAIAYRRSKGGPDYDLLFGYSETVLGLDPDDWEHTLVDGDEAAGYLNSVAIIDGNPAIAYYESQTKQLRYARSKTALGQTEA